MKRLNTSIALIAVVVVACVAGCHVDKSGSVNNSKLTKPLEHSTNDSIETDIDPSADIRIDIDHSQVNIVFETEIIEFPEPEAVVFSDATATDTRDGFGTTAKTSEAGLIYAKEWLNHEYSQKLTVVVQEGKPVDSYGAVGAVYLGDSILFTPYVGWNMYLSMGSSVHEAVHLICDELDLRSNFLDLIDPPTEEYDYYYIEEGLAGAIQYLYCAETENQKLAQPPA